MIQGKKQKSALPTYSLVGDLIGFVRCGLQYRMHRRAGWKSAYDGQLWYGMFIHRILSVAYSRFEDYSADQIERLDWKDHIRPIEFSVFNQLTNEGFTPPFDIFCPHNESETERGACSDINHPHKKRASWRAEAAIKILGPLLFPHIDELEFKLSSMRRIDIPGLDLEYYFLKGITDVILNFQDIHHKYRTLIQAEGTTIIDYKGASYPDDESDIEEAHYWQIIEYGWLYKQKTGILPKFGILVYLNDLYPFSIELETMRDELLKGNSIRGLEQMTDDDRQKIMHYMSNKNDPNDVPELSEQFRLARSIKVIPIESRMVDKILSHFDKIVSRIEHNVKKEREQSIFDTWPTRPVKKHCQYCDIRYICPSLKQVGLFDDEELIPAVPPKLSEFLRILHTKE
ncbi:MAG: PD-(D/E)XK nuclease family protein [Candidatus Heimdallarchaeota archaeon]|nr:PD-(D/E)XK nuclease family protein [Candidatus Heimdallarchaeota archaeon]